MKQMTKRSMMYVLVVLVVALVAVGCGSTTTTTAPAASTTTAAPAGSTTTAAPAGSTTTAAPTGGKIIVGCFTSLTGASAGAGSTIATGVKFAVKEWNDKGGINGQQIEVIVEDDQSTPTGAVNAFNKLVSQKPAFIVGPPFTGNVLAVEQSLKTSGKLPVFTGATNVAITQGGDGWFFRVGTVDSITSVLSAQFIIDDLKAKKPAIIYPNNDYGKGGYEGIKAYCDSKGIPLVAAETFTQGTDKDVTAQLTKIKNAGADALFCWTIPVDAAMVTLQSIQVGLKVPMLGKYATPDYLKLVGDSSEGIYSFLDTSASLDEATAAWTAAIKAFDPASNIAFSTAEAYDATNMALEQIAKGAATADALKAALSALVDYKGICGPFTFGADHNGLHQGVIGQYKSQKFTILKTITVAP